MWYYLNDGAQHGPVDEAGLDRLVAERAVATDTLVWREGLSDWIPLAQARGLQTPAPPVEDAASSTCTMCGKRVGADNLIELLGLRVCAACKPMAVQTLREGVTPAVSGGAWRDGKKVVTRDQQTLPARCYKCNQPVAEPPLKRKVYWHPALYYVLILVNIILYAIVAIIVRKRAAVEIYLCSQHARRRTNFIVGGWIGAALGIVLLSAGVVMSLAWMTATGFVLLAVSIIGGLVGANLARAVRIKSDTVWLGGAGPKFVASLPQWPK